MSKYLDLLEAMDPKTKDCGLGTVLREEGQEKHDIVLEAIFAINPDDGRPHSLSKLEAVFKSEYGWSAFFFRRHRNGQCVSCLNRIPIQKS
jgi:hypothetical protein